MLKRTIEDAVSEGMREPQKSWKPKFSLLGFISGAVWGLGGLVYMQQAGQIAMSVGQAAKALVPALLMGVVLPTVVRWIIVNRPTKPAASKPTAMGAAGLLAIAVAGVSLGQSSPASAQTCSLEVNGEAVSAGTVIEVEEADDLNAKFSGADVTGGSATVKYGPVSVYTDGFVLAEAKTGDVDRTVDREAITGKGVGLYQVIGTVNTNSGDCNFDFFVDVQGDPLSAPAGKAALATVGIGVLGSLAAIAKEIAAALAAIR